MFFWLGEINREDIQSKRIPARIPREDFSFDIAIIFIILVIIEVLIH
jgi:hypothetical protein